MLIHKQKDLGRTENNGNNTLFLSNATSVIQIISATRVGSSNCALSRGYIHFAIGNYLRGEHKLIPKDIHD